MIADEPEAQLGALRDAYGALEDVAGKLSSAEDAIDSLEPSHASAAGAELANDLLALSVSLAQTAHEIKRRLRAIENEQHALTKRIRAAHE